MTRSAAAWTKSGMAVPRTMTRQIPQLAGTGSQGKPGATQTGPRGSRMTTMT